MDPATLIKLALSLVLIIALSGCGGRANNRLIVLIHRVWLVNADGQIKPFVYPFPQSFDGSLQGSTEPVISPDGRFIAYGDPGGDGDAHLVDTHTLRSIRITRIGRAPTFNLAWIDVLLDGWSPDSRRLLLCVTHGANPADEGGLPIFAGFYEYNLKTQKLTCVRLPTGFQFRAWLRDERLLGVVPGNLPRDDRLVILSSDGHRQQTIKAIVGWPIQSQVSLDGNWVAGIHANESRVFGTGTAEIVKVNLKTMATVPLVHLNLWSGNEQPSLSPDDKHVAYIHEIHILYHVPKDSLLVDGRQIYACSGPLAFKWVNKQMIVVACQDEILALGANTGRVISKYEIKATQQSRVAHL
ncbi:MAG TPA: hypothetical protein VGX94_02925 [Terriglobia bacterium]|nr:hypothetical protein [Terriglobia bacterium]